MSEPFLIRPRIDYKESFIAAVREFQKEGIRPPWHYDKLDEHFDEYVEALLARESEPLPNFVPQTDYWLIAEGVYAGRIGLRHYLNKALQRFGGHIGYQIQPSMRHKGYGSLQLKLVLPKAWALGLKRVLITCDDDNIASYKIIENNGGVIIDKINNGRAVLTRRYWIWRPKLTPKSPSPMR
jgi:predicted acetyltransferase